MMQYNTGRSMNQSQGQGQGQQARFGALEMLETHGALTATIDAINQMELYRPHVQDQHLAQILDNHLNAMVQGYNNTVNFLSQTGNAHAVPYRPTMNTRVKYGLRNPSPSTPNRDWNQMNDQDVASGTLCLHKSHAISATMGALECADPTLRNLMTTCAQNHINMAYEVFEFMNERGYYQIPTMQQNTTETMLNLYQPVTMGSMDTRNTTFNPNTRM